MTPEPQAPAAIVPPDAPANGPFTLRDELGRTSEEGSLNNGVLDGELRVYSRGRIAGKFQYRDGLRNGDAILYNEAGDPVGTGTYRDGLLDGEWAYMDAFGTVVRRVLYRAGELEGRAVTFYPSGKPYQFCDYQSGLLEGDLLTYSEQGKLLDRLKYEAGRPVPAKT